MSRSVVELVREQARLKRRLREIDQELCIHDGDTYSRLEWTWHGTACAKCHKILKRVDYPIVPTGSIGG